MPVDCARRRSARRAVGTGELGVEGGCSLAGTKTITFQNDAEQYLDSLSPTITKFLIFLINCTQNPDKLAQAFL